MSKEAEDRVGKLSMIVIFSIVIYLEILYFRALFAHRATLDLWQLTMISKLFAIAFLGAILFFTVIRHDPVTSAPGLLPRLTAVGGTYAMMGLIALPSESISRPMQIVSTLLVITGTILSIMCLRRLGRSFSIMASARELVTRGPYSIVRHPLYGAELISVIGVIMAHGSGLAIAVGGLWLALQYQRARFEEHVLRQAFPAYQQYAERVPMMVPNLPQLIQRALRRQTVATPSKPVAEPVRP